MGSPLMALSITWGCRPVLWQLRRLSQWNVFLRARARSSQGVTLGLWPAGVACLYCICGIWWKCPRYKPDPSNIIEEGQAKIVWVMQGVLERSVWSGPPRCLWSCCLSLPCLTSACCPCTLLTRLTFLVLSPDPSWWLFLSKGLWGEGPPTGFPGN